MPEPSPFGRQEPFAFSSRRAPVYARGGMVAASQPLAAQAGVDILREGGSAADAAVACAAVLAVTEPPSTGLGGDGFALYFDAASGRVSGINGSGKSPAALTPALVRERGLGAVPPPRHPLNVTVPGVFSAWCGLLDRFGRHGLDRVLAPAVTLALEGFPVGAVAAHLWNVGAREVLGSAYGGASMLMDGRPPVAGELFRNPALGATLTRLAEAGGTQAAMDLFYRGEIADRVAAAVQAAGGVLETSDLAAHSALWDEPIHTDYRGARIYECAPNGQGIAALIALNILSELEFPVGDALSPERMHLMIEAMRLAFADTRRYVTDAQLHSIPVAELLSRSYARERALLIDPRKAGRDATFGVPRPASDTVYFCVVDGEGNACSMVNSVYKNFGTGITPEGLGFSLQNRGMNFEADPEHPCALGPSRRTYHTIIPGMALRSDGALLCPFGVMGAFMQPQGHVQVLSAMLDDGLNPQAALDRLRFCIVEGTAGGALSLEEGIPAATAQALESMGHGVGVVSGFGRSIFGRGQIIVRDPDSGWLCAGSDGRADGLAMGC